MIESSNILSKKVQTQVRNELRRAMDANHSHEWTGLEDFKFEKTSLILLKAVHITTNLKCTFSFDSSVPLHTADLINYFMELNPICRRTESYVERDLSSHLFS